MRRGTLTGLVGVAIGMGTLFAGYLPSVESPAMAGPGPEDDKRSTVSTPVDGDLPITVEQARDRAKLMHTIYASTLEALHHHYFRKGNSILPARAMEDVFDELAEQSKIQSRWIAVTTKAMSLDHQAESDFELEAVRQIASGKGEFERVEKDYYQRAGAIPLTAGCVGCHAGFSVRQTKSPNFAGLVIRIPLNSK
ncbi:DUF3365 domain-containing protein [Isosphaeraceae bacterium EP7]